MTLDAGRRPPKKQAGRASGPRRLNGELLDVAGVALLLGTTEKCIRARAARQLLPHRWWAGRLIFRRAEILTFLDQLEGCTVAQALENVATRTGEAAR